MVYGEHASTGCVGSVAGKDVRYIRCVGILDVELEAPVGLSEVYLKAAFDFGWTTSQVDVTM